MTLTSITEASVTIFRESGKVIWRDENGVERERRTGDAGGIDQTVKLYAGLDYRVVSRDEKRIVMSKGGTPPPVPAAPAVNSSANGKPEQRIPGGQAVKAAAAEKPAKKRGAPARRFCRECETEGRGEVAVYKDGLCKPHYAKRASDYDAKAWAKKNPCQHPGCTEPRAPYKKFCTAHLPLAAAPVNTPPVSLTIDPAADVRVPRRFCSTCLTAKPQTPEFWDLSKDGPHGMLNWTCRGCEAAH